MHTTGHNRSFALATPHKRRSSVDHTPWDNDHFFHDLPDPTGEAPFRMNLAELIGEAETAKISNEMVFHASGDTGNVRGDLQQKVADLMAKDAKTSDPAFFYHLGDVVYDYGEDREYPDQFYDVYKDYDRPIVAIPGNHDGARFDGGPDSLQGFMTNFCRTKPGMPLSLQRTGRHYGRDAMTQPNCYWTFNTPVCTIVGLYTNVPSGGDVREPQVAWFTKEIADAPKNKPLIVAMHHPVHSVALGSHAGSKRMDDLLLNACREAGRVPKMVLCGHVHNYQRFETRFLGEPCTFVVAGMGGHAKDKLKGPHDPNTQIEHEYPVTLVMATDQHVGFLKIRVAGGQFQCDYLAVEQDKPIDSFEV